MNAVRHAVWQAAITKQFGRDIAFEAGNAHEDNSNALYGVTDYSKLTFTSPAKADESIDLLNNRIGRDVGASNPNAGMRDMTAKVLTEFRNNGLWTMRKTSDGTFGVEKTKLTQDEFNGAVSKLRLLDDSGRFPKSK